MWAWDTPRRRVTPEAGYNLEEAHYTGWKLELAVLIWSMRPAEAKNTAMWPAETGYHNMTCGGKEYRNVACRDRIPQSSLRRRKYLNQTADIVAFERPYAATTRILPST